MKKLFLALLALPMFVSSCTQDEMIPQTNESKLDGLNIIESPLFSIEQDENAESRVTNLGAWESTDEVGLAFVGDGSIIKWNTNNNVYGNARLFLEDAGEGKAWKTTSVVYEGKHFAYYPFDAEHKTIEPMTKTLATTQEAGAEGYKKMWDKGRFAMSLPRILDNKTAGYNKTNEFKLFTLSNRLNLGLYISDRGDLEDDVNVTVKSVTLKATGMSNNNIFRQGLTLNPKGMTKTYTDAVTLIGKPGYEEKVVELFDQNLSAAVTYDAAVASIQTEIDDENEQMILGTSSAQNDVQLVTLFTFPTVIPTAADAAKLKLSIVVETNFGNVTIDAKDAANKEILNEIISFFNGTNEDKVDYSTRGEYAKNRLIAVDMNNVVLPSSFKIATETDWNDAVKAISMLGKSTSSYTFNLQPTNTEKTVYLNTITLPESDKYKLITVSGNNLQVAEDVALAPAQAVKFNTNLKIDAALSFEPNMLGVVSDYVIKSITVNATGAMTVGQGVQVTSDAIVNNGYIKNDGTISTTKVLDGKVYITNNGNFDNNGTLVNKGASAEIAYVSNSSTGIFKTYYYAAYENVKIDNAGQVILVEGNFDTFANNVKENGGTIEIAKPVATLAELIQQKNLGCTRVTVAENVDLNITNSLLNDLVIAMSEGSTLTGNGATVKQIITLGDASLAGNITVTDLNLQAESTLYVVEGADITVTNLDYSNATVDNSGKVTYSGSITNTNGTWVGETIKK